MILMLTCISLIVSSAFYGIILTNDDHGDIAFDRWKSLKYLHLWGLLITSLLLSIGNNTIYDKIELIIERLDSIEIIEHD